MFAFVTAKSVIKVTNCVIAIASAVATVATAVQLVSRPERS